jgi:predicted esterase YcpF (UPF0227 family)
LQVNNPARACQCLSDQPIWFNPQLRPKQALKKLVSLNLHVPNNRYSFRNRNIEQERLSREKLQKENEALAKLAADRHKEQQDALSELKKTLVSETLKR